jgi:hypothetical protein
MLKRTSSRKGSLYSNRYIKSISQVQQAKLLYLEIITVNIHIQTSLTTASTHIHTNLTTASINMSFLRRSDLDQRAFKVETCGLKAQKDRTESFIESFDHSKDPDRNAHMQLRLRIEAEQQLKTLLLIDELSEIENVDRQ